MPKKNRTIKDYICAVRKLMENSVYRQAALAGFAVLLTVVLVFAMSAAWYTNVVKTGDLIFQVEQWGFTGEVVLADKPIVAAPGDIGVIGLTMTNTGSDLVAADVRIGKEAMSADMQKRLYFYADTPGVVDGEKVDKIYLNSRQSYSYNIFSQGVLTLSETVYNDVQLKWYWVYDVLGYYVYGTLDAQTDKVQAVEYLQPVEYPYDEAKTTFDPDGRLLTVDGKTTVAQFLNQLSQNDGFAGAITVDDALWTTDGYYPVQVDESGTGVWVKLLSYSEIETEIIKDTAMGTGQEAVVAKARVTVTAENVLLEAASVTGAAQLQELLDVSGDMVLQLTDNLSVDQQITVPANTNAILDLNGCTITGTPGATTFLVEEGGALTLMDGKLENTNGTVVQGTGSDITLSNLTVNGYEVLLNVRDNKSQTDSLIRVTNCQANVTDIGIYLWGNGNTTRTETRLIVDNSHLVCDFAAIYGNGNDDSWGTDMQILNSTLEGKWVGIYQPQRNSTVTVSAGSTVTGYNGITLKAGSLFVEDSAIIGTGAYAPAKFMVSGSSDTGDGIYVETNYGHEVLVEVRGNSTVTGTQTGTYAIQIFEPDAPHVTVRVFGGTFSTGVENFLADGCTQTQSDGKFTVNSQ